MDTERSSQQTSSSTCISCHVISISAASILGVYMFNTAKKAQTTTHRFTCALFGLASFIFASHRVSALFKDISRHRIAATGGVKQRLEDRR